jgi:hypothetical protein
MKKINVNDLKKLQKEQHISGRVIVEEPVNLGSIWFPGCPREKSLFSFCDETVESVLEKIHKSGRIVNHILID